MFQINNKIFLFILLFLGIQFAGCKLTSEKYCEQLKQEYRMEYESIKQHVEETKNDYIIYEIQGTNKCSVAHDVAYFIYQEGIGKEAVYRYQKISGKYSYVEQGIHIRDWNSYWNILINLKNYNCEEDTLESPTVDGIMYYKVITFKDGIITKSIMYYPPWIINEDGTYSIDDVRNAESRFIFKFIIDISQTEMRELNMPTLIR